MTRYEALLDQYVDRYNARDLDACMELYADDAVQLMPDGLFEGRRAIADRLTRELAAFPDIEWGLLSYVEHGDAFADEWTFAGTHDGPLLLPDGTELAPTGRHVQVRGMELVRMRGDEIVVDNLYYDNLSVAAQLGLLPQPAASTVS